MTKTLQALSLPWPWKVMRLFWLKQGTALVRGKKELPDL